MKTLIIYDNEGYILSMRSGEPAPREPVGVPFLWVDIPDGKRIKITDGIGVDTSVTPHQAILEDIPPSEVDVLSQQVADLQYQLMMNGVI
ncbi:hypothetical protein [Bacillus smithii]|uniref:hypothetical protein n=1 Tax=Bacillus smithii TaxID=1479 RepID=UPI002E2163AB|nr:hypothetical protein [Bacillus smithii]MED1456664.1 hypothetical protein [Bacillus smithii]